MQIEIHKLPPDGSLFRGEHPASILELENDPLVRAEKPVRYDLTARLVSNEILVQGRISVEIDVKCSKCGEFFSTLVEDSSFLCTYEIGPGQDFLDVTEDIREDILLLIPAFPVCGESCKGVCLQCGRNLNEGPCGCAKKALNDPWGKLNRLDL
ncbi:MAG: DUF177 domain-containing protein [Kiritimatiellia bacterium]